MAAGFASLKTADDIEAIEELVCLAMTVRAAMELDVFSQLADGPRSPDEVAETLGVDPWRLSRLMHTLVHSGLVEVEDGKFSNAEAAARCLVKGQPEYMGSIHELWSDIFGAMLLTAESVKTGKPAALHDFSTMTDAELAALLRGLHAGSVRAGRSLATQLDLGRFDSLLDAGGGSGGVAIGVCEETAGMKAAIADLPRVAKIAEGFVGNAGLGNRVSVQGVDLAKTAPEGRFDVALLKSLLQTVSPEIAAKVVHHVGQAVRPGGEIHILGRVLEDNRIHPSANSIFDMVFVNFYEGGAAHLYSEHVDWLEKAGFGQVSMRNGPMGARIVSAVKS